VDSTYTSWCQGSRSLRDGYAALDTLSDLDRFNPPDKSTVTWAKRLASGHVITQDVEVQRLCLFVGALWLDADARRPAAGISGRYGESILVLGRVAPDVYDTSATGSGQSPASYDFGGSGGIGTSGIEEGYTRQFCLVTIAPYASKYWPPPAQTLPPQRF
jgi:hypothetical protein